MHISVLLHEAINALSIKENACYVDATFGEGGHSQKILQQLPQGRLIVIDKDPAAIAKAKALFGDDARVSIHHASFAEIERIVKKENMYGKVAGILMDLGVSSPQLDEAERGFSFMRDGPLDMRMDTSQGQTVQAYLDTVDVDTLTKVLKDFGEERFARKLAVRIIERRQQKSFTTTLDLAEFVKSCVPKKEQHKHPATRTFQALRIAVNNELTDLQSVLASSIPCLAIGGRLCCISFHSLEDRIVKQFMRRESQMEKPPKGMPIIESDIEDTRRLKLIGKAVKASQQEVNDNVRARSAVLRVAERVQ